MPDPLDLYSFHESRSCWHRGGFSFIQFQSLSEVLQC